MNKCYDNKARWSKGVTTHGDGLPRKVPLVWPRHSSEGEVGGLLTCASPGHRNLQILSTRRWCTSPIFHPYFLGDFQVKDDLDTNDKPLGRCLTKGGICGAERWKDSLWKEIESFRMWFPAVILSHRRKKEHYYKFKANLIYIANQKPSGLDF